MAWRWLPVSAPGMRNRYGACCDECTGWCPPGDGTVTHDGERFIVTHIDCTGKESDSRPYKNRRHDLTQLGFAFVSDEKGNEMGHDEAEAEGDWMVDYDMLYGSG